MRTLTLMVLAGLALAAACGTTDKEDRRIGGAPTLDSLALTDRVLFDSGDDTIASGPWQFMDLMRGLVPGGGSSRQASDLAKSWLLAWSAVRPAVREKILCPWLDASNGVGGCRDGELDPAKAPFKPIAIVNRMDLHDPEHCEDAGELRIAFAWVDAAGREQPTTVIFEYVLPTHFNSVAEWARIWKGIGNFRCAPGNCEEFRGFVEAITSQVVEAPFVSEEEFAEADSDVPMAKMALTSRAASVDPVPQRVGNLRHVRVHDKAFGPTDFREFDLGQDGFGERFVLAASAPENLQKCAGCHTGSEAAGERFNVAPTGGDRLHPDLAAMMPARAERLDELESSACERTPGGGTRSVPW